MSEDQIDHDKRIDCAAVKGADGIIWHGHRHGHCFATIAQMRKLGYIRKPAYPYIQGFITQSGRFVDRKEAAMIAVHSGQVKDRTLPFKLFSEDLY